MTNLIRDLVTKVEIIAHRVVSSHRIATLLKTGSMVSLLTGVLWFVLACSYVSPAYAHHVLGRPAYSLNEDSNTPPSLAIEAQIGDFYVTYMVFPAFPKANQPGRLNLYIQGIEEGTHFDGDVVFTVVDDGFFADHEEPIGTQSIDDGVYRQGFIFTENGKYIIRAHFDTNDDPYDIDFPLQVGEPSPLRPLVFATIVLFIALFGVNIFAGKKLQIAKFRMQKKDSAP